MNAYYSGLLFSSLLNCLSLFRERGVLWPIALNFKSFITNIDMTKKKQVNYDDMKEGSIGCLDYELSEHFYTL